MENTNTIDCRYCQVPTQVNALIDEQFCSTACENEYYDTMAFNLGICRGCGEHVETHCVCEM